MTDHPTRLAMLQWLTDNDPNEMYFMDSAGVLPETAVEELATFEFTQLCLVARETYPEYRLRYNPETDCYFWESA